MSQRYILNRQEQIKHQIYTRTLPTLARLPKIIAYPLTGKLASRYFWQRERQWMQAYRSGLSTGFPNASAHELDTWTRKHFRMLGRENLDVYYFKYLNKQNIKSIAQLHTPKLKNTKGIPGNIIIMGHLGRPLMLCAALGLEGYPTGMLSQAVDERNPNLDAPTRSFLQYKMHHATQLAGGRWVTTVDPLKSLYMALHNGETLVIMMDLVEPNPHRQICVPFLQGYLRLPPGILRLAEKTQANLYYGSAKDNGQQVLCRVTALSNNGQQALNQAANLLQKEVMEQPWQWWQWNNFQALWTATSQKN